MDSVTYREGILIRTVGNDPDGPRYTGRFTVQPRVNDSWQN